MSDTDVMQVKKFAERCVELIDFRESLQEYLRQRMSAVAPSLTALIGEMVGSKLISHSGSLINLAKYPASIIQILGAEKALFRALKTKGKTPKYGLIFNSTFIGRAGRKTSECPATWRTSARSRPAWTPSPRTPPRSSARSSRSRWRRDSSFCRVAPNPRRTRKP